MTIIPVFIDPAIDTYDYNRIAEGLERTATTTHAGGLFDAKWFVTYGKDEAGDANYETFTVRQVGTAETITVALPESVAIVVDLHDRLVFSH